MEVRMERFGINAKADEPAYLFTFAEAVLMDRRTGREIWNVNMHGRDRLSSNLITNELRAALRGVRNN